MTMPVTIRQHYDWLHGSITSDDPHSAMQLIETSRFHLENIQTFADLPPEAGPLLDDLLRRVVDLAAAHRQSGLRKDERQAAVEPLRQAALRALMRLRPILDRANLSEEAQILGLG